VGSANALPAPTCISGAPTWTWTAPTCVSWNLPKCYWTRPASREVWPASHGIRRRVTRSDLRLTESPDAWPASTWTSRRPMRAWAVPTCVSGSGRSVTGSDLRLTCSDVRVNSSVLRLVGSSDAVPEPTGVSGGPSCVSGRRPMR